MTTRTSNSEFLAVLQQIPLVGVGWYVRVLSERDRATQIALIERFVGMGFTKEENGVGGGKVVLDAADRLFTDPLPAGESHALQDQQALWQFIDNGIVRQEMFAEDLSEDILTEDGVLTTEISGRGTGLVLEWAMVEPVDGITSRKFTDSPMAVWTALFLEAQANGYVPFVSLLFDEAQDSAAQPWGGAQELTVKAGDNLLDLLTRWCEAGGYAWKMLPGFRLQVMKNPGQNRESTVVFTMYRDQGGHKRKVSRREIANAVFSASGDDAVAVALDNSSIQRWGRRGMWTEAGDSSDESGRAAVANATLATRKHPKESRDITVAPSSPGREVFVDYDVSDYIGIEGQGPSDTPGARKVVAISIDIDTDGYYMPELTLQSRFETRMIKQQKALDKMGASSSSGSGSSPIPVSKTVSAVKLDDLSNVSTVGRQTGDLLQWNGGSWQEATPNLNLLADVDAGTIPADGDVALVYNRTTGVWEPGTVAASAPAPGGGMVHSYAGTETVGVKFQRVTNNRVYMKQVTLTAPGLLSSIEWHVNDDAYPGSVESMAGAVMQDIGGIPGRVIAAEQMPANSLYLFHESRWLAVAVGKWLEAGTYWIAAAAIGEAGEATQVAYDDGGTDMYYTSGGAWLADGAIPNGGGGYANTQTTQNFSIRASVIQ